MGLFDGIYFGCDLDGTLLGKESNDISREDIDAIKYFISEGGRFGFCTGRLPSELKDYHQKVGTNAPSVCCNGSLIYDLGGGSFSIVREANEDILPFLSYIEKEFPNIMIDLDTPDAIYYYRPNPSLDKHKSIAIADFRSIEHFSLAPRPWVKIALWGMPDDVRALAEKADRSKLSENYVFHYSFEYCCEITSVGGDKCDALLKAAELMGNIRKVISMGDNENDITVLRGADISFAPANAVDSAKAAAKFPLSRDCDHSAVSEAIELLKKQL